MKTISVAFLAAFVLFCSVAFAEGGCPPGQFPQQGPGWRSCVGGGGGGGESYEPPAVWEERFGAVATDATFNGNNAGWVANKKSRAEAEKGAMENCAAEGAQNCKIKLSYHNGCGAVAFGAKFIAFWEGRTEREAQDAALKECRRGANPPSACEVVYSECSQAVRIR